MSGRPYFSIVIPTLNEEKYLPLLLKDLTQQTYTNFEVIHVDGNSDDATVKAASLYMKKLPLRTKVVTKRNVSYQRNTGGKMAKGEWVIFMDADNRLPSYFLQGIRYRIDQHSAMDIFTCCVLVDSREIVHAAIQRAWNSALELYFLIGKVMALGAMIGVKRTILKTHVFDETQKVYEDSQFAQSVVDGGYTFMLFKDPAFGVSLRRIEKEGFLRSARIIAKAHLRYLQGKNASDDDSGYVMLGGAYYDSIPPLPFKNLRTFLKTASEKQLQKAKQLLKEVQKQL